MEMVEADATDNNEAEEYLDRNRGGLEETKEVLKRTLEGNTSEEKMEIGSSGDIVEPEEGGKKGNLEKSGDHQRKRRRWRTRRSQRSR